MNFFSPYDVTKNYVQTGVAKTRMCLGKLLLLGLLAGLMIAFAGAATNTAAYCFTNISAVRLICGLLFPFGLGLVIVLGLELFTGNCLILISVLDRQASFFSMLRNWVMAYCGNFLGALLLAAGCAFFGQLNYSDGGLAVFTIKMAAAKCALPFGNGLVLGFFCNVLVCVAVLCASSAKDIPGRLMGAYIPVALFVLCGFEHCVANMYYVPAGLFALQVPEYAALAAQMGVDISTLSWGGFLINNLLPVTLRNILGGAAVAVAMWAVHLKKGAQSR